ncbi:hypothetical protein OG21DRAFT_151588 [Imleria badia]|nr:hypothetical protein OG21DRAFT_151588 [Imleria badia]
MPEPGIYVIVNREAPALAVNFNGVNRPLTVEPLNYSAPQRWHLVGPPGGMQSIAPLIAQDFQTSPRGDIVAPDPPPFLWNLVGPGIESTIVDVHGPQLQLWTIYGGNDAAGERVVLRVEGQGNQNWVFRRAG